MSGYSVTSPQREWKYKVEQTAYGARVTVHSMSIEEAVADYGKMRNTLKAQGWTIAPENDIVIKDKTNGKSNRT